MSYFEDTLTEYLALLEIGGDGEAFLARHRRIRTRLLEHARLAGELAHEAGAAIDDGAKARALEALLGSVTRLREERSARSRRPRRPRRRLWAVAGVLGFGLAFSVSFASGADPSRPLELFTAIPQPSLPDISLALPVDIPAAVYDEPEPSGGCADCPEFIEKSGDTDRERASHVTPVMPSAAAPPSPRAGTPSRGVVPPTPTRPAIASTPHVTPTSAATPKPPPTVVSTRHPTSTPASPSPVASRTPQLAATPTFSKVFTPPPATSTPADPVVYDPCPSRTPTPTATPDESALKPQKCTPVPSKTPPKGSATPDPDATPGSPLTPKTPAAEEDETENDSGLAPPGTPPETSPTPTPTAVEKPPPED